MKQPQLEKMKFIRIAFLYTQVLIQMQDTDFGPIFSTNKIIGTF